MSNRRLSLSSVLNALTFLKDSLEKDLIFENIDDTPVGIHGSVSASIRVDYISCHFVYKP
jgi:hypothetical protein